MDLGRHHRAKDQRDDIEGVGIADGDDLVDHLETAFEVAGIDPPGEYPRIEIAAADGARGRVQPFSVALGYVR